MPKPFVKHNDLYKLFITLFETNVGLFYRRNYNISSKSILNINKKPIGTVEEILNKDFFEKKQKMIEENIIGNKKKTYSFTIDVYSFIIIKTISKNEEQKDNTLIIHTEGKSSTMQHIFKLERLLFNLTKHKYVPNIFLIENPIDIEIDKLPKIKNNDPLIKFYGITKNNVCKIQSKASVCQNIDISNNYRLVI